MNSNIDEYWMAQAIKLAQQGRYTTAPNPSVGCIIVDANGRKVGQGAHLLAGEPHAEVFALQQAQSKASGSTAYVTLEPCSHIGKTPPCTDALIKANIARVVVANIDPNPSVDGSGIDKLRKAGVEVVTNVLAKQAEQLNLGFFKRMRRKQPYIRVKMAASLDGRTALSNGVSQWITSEEARRDVQLYRAESCAVLTASGTVRDDNPSLLVRPQQAQFSYYPDITLRQPLRVVVEGKRPLDSHYQLFNDGQSTMRVTANEASRESLSPNVDLVRIDGIQGFPDLTQIFTMLAQKKCNEVWVEAGSILAGALIEKGLFDELIVYVAAKLIGQSGAPLVRLPEFTDLMQVPQLELKDCVKMGNDVRLTYVPKQ